jgi:hypothetical protein
MTKYRRVVTTSHVAHYQFLLELPEVQAIRRIDENA